MTASYPTASSLPDARELTDHVRRILSGASLHTITMRHLRAQLNDLYGINFSPFKAELSQLVNRVLQEGVVVSASGGSGADASSSSSAFFSQQDQHRETESHVHEDWA
jgi:hypothetical protein